MRICLDANLEYYSLDTSSPVYIPREAQWPFHFPVTFPLPSLLLPKPADPATPTLHTKPSTLTPASLNRRYEILVWSLSVPLNELESELLVSPSKSPAILPFVIANTAAKFDPKPYRTPLQELRLYPLYSSKIYPLHPNRAQTPLKTGEFRV